MGNSGKYSDSSKYEILFDLKEGEYNQTEVGGIRTKTYRMGEVIEVECFPLTHIGPVARAAAQEKRKQRACQMRLNRRNAEKRIRRLTDMNFTTEDYVVTLTWNYGYVNRFTMSYEDVMRNWDKHKLPIEEEDARWELKKYWKRVRNRIRRTGNDPKELRYIYVLEMTHTNRQGQNPDFPHYHFHCIIHAPGLSMDDLEELWPHGWERVERLSVKNEGVAGLAHYLTKHHSTEEIDSSGRRIRRWGTSRNLKEPKETVSDRKVSRRRARLIAEDVMRNAAEAFSNVRGLEDYDVVNARVFYSDYVNGAYIYARLRYNPDKAEANRKRREEEDRRMMGEGD